MQNLLACTMITNFVFSRRRHFSVAVEFVWMSKFFRFKCPPLFTCKNVFWSLCAVCKVVRLFCPIFFYRQHNLNSERWKIFDSFFSTCMQNAKYRCIKNSVHCNADTDQMNRSCFAAMLHDTKKKCHQICASNYQDIQFADKHTNCVVNVFNLHAK